MSIASNMPIIPQQNREVWIKPAINIISINNNTLGGTADTADGGPTDNS